MNDPYRADQRNMAVHEENMFVARGLHGGNFHTSMTSTGETRPRTRATGPLFDSRQDVTDVIGVSMDLLVARQPVAVTKPVPLDKKAYVSMTSPLPAFPFIIREFAASSSVCYCNFADLASNPVRCDAFLKKSGQE